MTQITESSETTGRETGQEESFDGLTNGFSTGTWIYCYRLWAGGIIVNPFLSCQVPVWAMSDKPQIWE